ncbi:ABC-type sugar transport system periplasmic component-like protein [Candidatus Protofrankia datiscae]|uniref:ABC-type sugar transport system periplasmic component-like protein n=2 Tax=Protofrankia TaxID=2994361 RepID=F8B0M2_9ACTN|nr:ABC-type sugar transport system periplasmic component-like protein [Candidatus Protofrankia datiscae]
MIHLRAVRRSTSGMLAAVTAVALVAAAGCSSSGPDLPDATGGGAASASGDGYTATAREAVDAAYKGLYSAPAKGGPSAQKGKNIWVIPCSSALFGCSEPAAAIQEAGRVLDWKVTTADGKASPAGYTAAINQAVAAHADGIITIAIDCPPARAGLQAAKNARIPTVAVWAYDCDDPKAGGGASLYSATINSSGTPAQFGTRWGTLKADYAIAATGGRAKVLLITHPDFVVTQYEEAGYREELARCGGCQIVDTVDITGQDLGNPATTAQKVATALQKHPEANVVDAPDDTTMAEISQVITARQNSDLVVVTGEGYPSTVALIRKKVVTAAGGVPANWLGWEGADAMNRVLAGETTIPNQGASFQIIDAEHGLPASDSQSWTPSVDYRAAFTANWTG